MRRYTLIRRTIIIQSRSMIRNEFRRLKVHIRVRQWMSYTLVLTNRSTKHDAFLSVFRRFFLAPRTRDRVPHQPTDNVPHSYRAE